MREGGGSGFVEASDAYEYSDVGIIHAESTLGAYSEQRLTGREKNGDRKL